MTSLQNRALGKGMAATVQRVKDQKTTTVRIKHSPAIDSRSVFDNVKHGLLVRAGLNASTTSIELADDSTELQETIAHLMRENQQLRAENQRLLAQPSLLLDQRKWMKVRDAVDELGISKATLYRAIDDHRIETKSSRVVSKRNHQVDPTTYRPKTRPAAKPKPPKIGKQK